MKKKIIHLLTAVTLCMAAFFIGTTFSKTEKIYVEKPVVPYGYISLFDVDGWESFTKENRVCLEIQTESERYEVSKDAFTAGNVKVKKYAE